MGRLQLLLVVMLIESCVAYDDPCANCTMPACKRLGDKIGVEARCQLKSDPCDVFQKDGWRFCLKEENCTCCIPECGKSKTACVNAGGVCQLRTAKCNGRMLTGKHFCFYGQTCGCCVPIDCSKKTLRPCKALNGTCINKDKACDGREVTDKTFCKNSDTCKCCFPETPRDIPTTCPPPQFPTSEPYSDITTTCPPPQCPTTEPCPEDSTTKAPTTPSSEILNTKDSTTQAPTTPSSETLNTRCLTSGGHPLLGQCFKAFVDQRLNWEDGKAKCESEGLRLAEPRDGAALPLKKYLADRYGLGHFWLGAHGDGSKFVWDSDQTELSSHNTLWIGNQGSDVSTDRCVWLYANEYSMNNYPGQAYYTYTCSIGYVNFVLCEVMVE